MRTFVSLRGSSIKGKENNHLVVKRKRQMEIKYRSTRGGVSGYTFQEALLSGFAPDGGLFVPDTLPKFSRDDIKSWADLTYPQLIEKFTRFFISRNEVTDQEISEILDGCFSKFDDPEVISLTKVGSVHVAELWHGPTGAFKDIALSVVGRLMDHFLKQQGKKATVLVSTSGDTGSAAIHSVLNSKNINVVVMYPRGRVSCVQELQMTTVNAPNVRVLSVDGTSDDQDVVMKKVSTDASFANKYNITCINSVNVARVLFQAVHFIYTYLRLCPEADRDVLFCIPSGGLGNLAGGVVAREMGLPVKFLSAVNENDVVHRVFQEGKLVVAADLTTTYSSAMDIQLPYNIERVFYYMSGRQTDAVKVVMESFESGKNTPIPKSILENNSYITTMRVSNEETLAVMKQTWKEYGYLLCPHTAVGMQALSTVSDKLQWDCQDRVLIATATPAKFREVVAEAGLPLPAVPVIEKLFTLKETKLFLEQGENWEEKIKEVIMSFQN